jgi:hypothetical protein
MLLLNDYFIIKYKIILLLETIIEYGRQNINQLFNFHLLFVDYFIHT